MIRQWTVSGSPALEKKIDKMIAGLRSRLAHRFGPEDYQAVMITGGYGRGEGGVEVKNGQETLHNNLDLIWVTPHAAKLDLIREKLEQEALHFQRNHGIALDTFVIDEAHLRRLPCLVMIYDMRHGHRQLLGKPGYLKEILRYGAEDILPSDVRNLMVNRGTLLLINRWLLNLGEPTPELRKQIVRHAMKAVIGMGDALLFMRGEYHWSYLDKAHRMQLALDLPLKVRKAYDQAALFRFKPDYQAFENMDLYAWNEDLIHMLQQSHLQFESWRLGIRQKNFMWVHYPKQVLRHNLMAEWQHRGTRLRRIKHFLTNQSFSSHLNPFENLGLRATDSASLLALLFPVVAYELAQKNYMGLVREQLQSASFSRQELLEDYLRAWATYMDPALLNNMKKWKAAMSRQEVAA